LDSLHWCCQRRRTTELSIENFRFQLRFRPKPYASDHVESSAHPHGCLPATTGFGMTLRPRVKRTCSESGHGGRRATIGVTSPQLSGKITRVMTSPAKGEKTRRTRSRGQLLWTSINWQSLGGTLRVCFVSEVTLSPLAACAPIPSARFPLAHDHADKPFAMCTCEKGSCKSSEMRSCKIKGVKLPWNQHLRKLPGGPPSVIPARTIRDSRDTTRRQKDSCARSAR